MSIFPVCSLGNEPNRSSTTLLFAAMFGEKQASKQAKKTKSKLVFRHCFWQCAKSCQEKKGRNCNDDKFWINTMPARILSKSPWAADLPGSNSSFRAKCEQLLSSLKVTF